MFLRMLNDECELLLNAMAFLKVMVMEKCILYCFKLRRLTLGIGNLMSSHSLSAGHVPLVLGRDSYIELVPIVFEEAQPKFKNLFLEILIFN